MDVNMGKIDIDVAGKATKLGNLKSLLTILMLVLEAVM